MNKVYPIILFALLFVLCVHTLTSINQDIGRHLVLGQKIVSEWSVPKTNLFSYTAGDFPFINHHWLGEVFLYLASVVAGLKGLILFKAIIIVGAFALAYLAVRHQKTVLPIAIAGLVSILIFIERTDVRPEIFSFLFFGWYLFVLYGKSEDRRFLWTLPVVQVLWVNTHIYFFMGPVVIALFVASKALSGAKLSDIRRIWGPIITAIAFANFVNPSFWKGALYPLFLFGNYGYSIVENKGPFFLKAWGYPWFTTWALFVGFGLCLLSFGLNWRAWRNNIFSASIAVLTFGMSLWMVRNYPLFALAMLPVCAKNFAEAELKISDKKIHFVAIAILLAMIFGATQNQIGARGGKFGLDIPRGGQDAVDFIKKNNIRGPMFNNFDQGSFLIWKLPEEKVFIDGRPEAYPAGFIQDVYIKMQENPLKWLEYSEKYDINFVFWNWQDITPWSQQFLSHISQNKKWPLVYRDGNIMIFLKNTPENVGVLNR